MAAVADKPDASLRKWPAESEIEAYRRELEASFLQEEAALEAKRREVLDRLDLLESNTLSEVHAEREVLRQRSDKIMALNQALIEERFKAFLSGFHCDDLVEELARASMALLCPNRRQVDEGSG